MRAMTTTPAMANGSGFASSLSGLASDRGVRNAVCPRHCAASLTAHRAQDGLDPFVFIGVEEPGLDRMDIVRSRRRFSRAATFLYPHLFDRVPGEDGSFLATHHIHHR